MSRCSDRVSTPACGAALALATFLSACSDIYYDRRETVFFGAADAVATNRIAQTADPWPPAAANRRLAYDGAVMAAAVARYRTGQVIPPRGAGTSTTQLSQQMQQMQQMQQPLAPSLLGPVAGTSVK